MPPALPVLARRAPLARRVLRVPTGATGPSAANNGLTLAPGPTVQLGGVLNQDTNILFGGPVNNFSLAFGNNIGPGPQANLKLGNTAGISATQTANAQFGGSVSSPIRVVTGNYTLANDDYTVLCNNTPGGPSVTITPPAAAASNKGRVYIIKRVNQNIGATINDCEVANVDGIGGNVVLQGPTPGLLTTNLSGVTIQSDGTQWWIVGTITGTIPPTAVEGVATGSVSTSYRGLPHGERRAIGQRGHPGLGQRARDSDGRVKCRNHFYQQHCFHVS